MEARNASTEVVRIVKRKQNRIITIAICLFIFESYTIKVSVTDDDGDDDVIGVTSAFLLWYFTEADVVGKIFC